MKTQMRASLAYLIAIFLSLIGGDQVFAQGGTWTMKAPIPTPRHGTSTALAPDGMIYVSGGYHNTTTPANEAYDPATDSWFTKTSMPTAAQPGDEGARVRAVIYVEGGESFGFCQNYNFAYNTKTNGWRRRAPMPTSRCGLGAISLHRAVYAIGGSNTSGSIDYALVEVYNPKTNLWAMAAPMPTARRNLALAVFKGKIYAIGGGDSSGTVLATVEVYDPGTNSWTTKASMPTARSNLQTVALNGLIYAIGGVNGSALSTVEVYDPVTDSWSTGTPLPTPEFGAGAAATSNAIYVISGYGGTDDVPFVYEFTPAARLR